MERESNELVIANIQEQLQEVVFLMNVLVRLNMPNASSEEADISSDQKTIYDLCDATHTIEEIADKVGKPRNQINTNLGRLKNKGLVESLTKGQNAYYFRISSASSGGDED